MVPAPSTDHHVAVGDPGRAGRRGRAHGRRLDEHGGVRRACRRAQRWSWLSWATERCPAAAGVGSRSRVWMPGSRVAEGEVRVVVEVARAQRRGTAARCRGPRGRAPARGRRGSRRRCRRPPRGRARTGTITIARSSGSRRALDRATGRSRRSRPGGGGPAHPARARAASSGSTSASSQRARRVAPAPPGRTAPPATLGRRRSAATLRSNLERLHRPAIRLAASRGHHAGRSGAAAGGRPAPSPSARRASPACGRSRPGGSRG